MTAPAGPLPLLSQPLRPRRSQRRYHIVVPRYRAAHALTQLASGKTLKPAIKLGDGQCKLRGRRRVARALQHAPYGDPRGEAELGAHQGVLQRQRRQLGAHRLQG